jgi:hypothetical protein
VPDFLLLMHKDSVTESTAEQWDAYFGALSQSGCFLGGSSIGGGETFRQQLPPGPVGNHIEGFVRVRAENATAARQWVECNPVYLCGGTVELRDLPED